MPVGTPSHGSGDMHLFKSWYTFWTSVGRLLDLSNLTAILYNVSMSRAKIIEFVFVSPSFLDGFHQLAHCVILIDLDREETPTGG